MVNLVDNCTILAFVFKLPMYFNLTQYNGNIFDTQREMSLQQYHYRCLRTVQLNRALCMFPLKCIRGQLGRQHN